MSSIIPKTAIFRAEQKKARQECQQCYRIVSDLTKAHYKLLQSYEELITTIESKLQQGETLELTEDQEIV